MLQTMIRSLIYFIFILNLSLGYSLDWYNSENNEIENFENAEPLISEINIQMPGVISHKNDTYLCTSYAFEDPETKFIIEFDPIADMREVHHVLLFGCEEPGSEEPVWNCGEMSLDAKNNKNLHAPTCTTQPNILYAWAHNAPKLELPKDVAFRVGGETKSKYLVLQVHYMHKLKQRDYSGVKIFTTPQEQPKLAATLLMVTGGQINAKSTELMESACVVDEPIEMHPFAFRVHTHRHGEHVDGYVVRENPITGKDNWQLLGERNPQLPQLFEKMNNQSIVITQGDILAARCKIRNNENRVIHVGPSGEDEMCNFYLMYWVDGNNLLEDNICYSNGPPNYTWGREAALNNIPKIK